MSSTVRIVFAGEILPGHDPETVKRAVADLLRAPPEQLALLFSGQKIILRKGLQEAEAPRFVDHLTRTGIRVFVQPEEAPVAAAAAAPAAPVPAPSPAPAAIPPTQLSVEPTVVVTPQPRPAAPPQPAPQPMSHAAEAAMLSVAPTVVVSPQRTPAAPAIPPANPARWDEATMLVTPDAYMGGAAAPQAAQQPPAQRPPQAATPQPAPQPYPPAHSDATIIVTPQQRPPAPPAHGDATIVMSPQRPAAPQPTPHSDATVIVSRAELEARGMGGAAAAQPAAEALTPAQLWAQAAAAAAAANSDVPLIGIGFEGRLGRLSYFTGSAFVFAIAMLAGCLCLRVAMALPAPVSWIIIALGVIFYLASLPLQLRQLALRLHDIGYSGWWSLLVFVPFVGGIIPLALLFIPGNPGSNAFGLQAKPVSTGLAIGAGCAALGAVIAGTLMFLL